jgi:molecular chaperone GrpE
MIKLADNEQGDLRSVMQDPQEMSAEQQEANRREKTNTQPTNVEQVAGNGEQQASAQMYPSYEGRIAELEAQLALARREATDNWNRYLRERADIDNIRKRQERLTADRVLQQKKALFKQILEVMDNVERALVYQETMDKQDLQQVLRMLQWQMGEVLRAEGLNPVPTIGEVFNPYIHEAVEAVENSDEPEGTILEELRKGYTLGEETLRPARVKVSVGYS